MESQQKEKTTSEEEMSQRPQGRPQEGQAMTSMKPVTKEAYGGGMYGKEEGEVYKQPQHPASETQSADGPGEATLAQTQPKHTPPPSTGDRDLDITGQSYIQ